MSQSPLLFIILLGVLITVHELGHFLLAKLLNVKVVRFSIGFGPKLIGFTRGETEYQIALLPLGGYVKMAGELPHDETSPEDAARGFLAQPPWKRALIVLGGPVFNLVFPLFIYFLVFFGAHERLAANVGYVEPASPAAAAGLLPGDKVVAVNGEPVKAFDQFTSRLSERAGIATPVTVERDGKTVQLEIKPETAFAADVFADTRGHVGAQPISPAPLLGVPSGSAAEQAGLKTFDRVVQVNGEPVQDLASLEAALDKAEGTVSLTVARLQRLELPGIGGAEPKLVTAEIPLQEGEGLAAIGAERGDLYLSHVYPGGPASRAGLRPGDRLVAVNGKPLMSFGGFQTALGSVGKDGFSLEWRSGGEEKKADLAIGKFETTDPFGQKVPMEGVGVIAAQGLGGAEDRKVDRVTVDIGVWEAFKLSALKVPSDIGKTVMVLGRLVTGDLPFGTVGGPIMMYQLTTKTAEMGFDSYLLLMGIISVNLGIMNLLPIPILDGFALLSALWEAIRRRPIPMRAREVANMVGLLMLAVLMFFVFKNDLTR